jgi:excisionase family DNA binding protein
MRACSFFEVKEKYLKISVFALDVKVIRGRKRLVRLTQSNLVRELRAPHRHPQNQERIMRYEPNKKESNGEASGDRLLDSREVAAMLRISERTLFTLRKAGKLPCLRVGSSVRFSSRAMEVWIAEQQMPSAAERHGRQDPGEALASTGKARRKERNHE